MNEEIPHSRQPAIDFFKSYSSREANLLKGKKIYDLSAGSGFIANLFLQQGAEVFLFDLFPDQNKYCPQACQFIDLQNPFPIDSNTADVVICAETMEHLPNQYFFFQEASRIIKPHGKLIITTPNVSSLRSRFSQFVGESEHYSTPLPNEFNAFTNWPDSSEGYFSKIFLSGILRLRLLAALHGFSIHAIEKTRASSTSVWLLVLYPLIYYFSVRNYKKQWRLHPSHQKASQQIFELNTSLKILLSKHLIMEFKKNN